MHLTGLLGMPRRVYTYQAGLGWDLYNLISTVGAFIFAAGVLVLVVNLVWSHFNGKEAGPNPWNADSLEWATASPPVNYGFGLVPIVRSRHPLWEQDDLHKGDDRTESLVRSLAKWPLSWRAALVTSPLEARPVEVFRVSGPGIWPVCTAVGVIIIFASEIWSFHIPALVGVLIIIASLVGWHWPQETPTTEAEEKAFEKEHGIGLWTSGSRTVGRSGMLLLILILWIALACFLFSYFFIRLDNPVWPIDNIALPNLPLAITSAVILLVSGGIVYWAVESIRGGSNRRLASGLALGFILTAIALGIQIYDYTQLSFDWNTNAYGSLSYVMGTFAGVVIAGGMLINALTQVFAWRGKYTARRHVMAENTAIYWYTAIALWFVVFGTLYVSPYLI